MTDKEYKYQKKRIKRLSKKWVKQLGLSWWRVTHEYYREEQPPSVLAYKPPSIEGKWTCVFDVSADYYYKTAHINCYLLQVRNIEDDRDLEEYYLHELMHILIKPMQTPSTKKEEELVATSLAQAFLWSQK